ncbi:MAG TPA: hypothetical protein VFE51_24945, partial [Verrucomicrobiae bacterium]|nr:hypothetical protein [Verrucomicrobiae bacterium]
PSQERKVCATIYKCALFIPVLAILGGFLSVALRKRRDKAKSGHEQYSSNGKVRPRIKPNWWILSSGFLIAGTSMSLSFDQSHYAKQIVLLVTLGIVLIAMYWLLKQIDNEMRANLIGTALIVFAFRALPSPGIGLTWWTIDILKFEPRFFAALDLFSNIVALLALLTLRRWLAKRSVSGVIATLTVLSAVVSLPNIAMFYGFHLWTYQHSRGFVDARFIATIDTALESPLSQLAVIPMLVWIARAAPEGLRATFFAVMSSLLNVARLTSQLGTHYLAETYIVERQIRDSTTGSITVNENYSNLGRLLWSDLGLTLLVPFLVIGAVEIAKRRRPSVQ